MTWIQHCWEGTGTDSKISVAGCESNREQRERESFLILHCFKAIKRTMPDQGIDPVSRAICPVCPLTVANWEALETTTVSPSLRIRDLSERDCQWFQFRTAAKEAACFREGFREYHRDISVHLKYACDTKEHRRWFTWGAEAAISTVIFAELGPFRIGTSVSAGRSTLLVLHVERTLLG